MTHLSKIDFTAYFADGARDQEARTIQPAVLHPVALSARMTAPPDGSNIDNYLYVTLAGAERDDPSQPDGECRPAEELTPTSLVLTIGSVTLRTSNDDEGSLMRHPSIYGCHGTVLVESAPHPPVA